jgi:hypothetical protein
MPTTFQAFPHDRELLAFEAGCEDREREVNGVEWQGGQV